MNKSIKKYFTKTGGLAVYLTILSLGLTSCNNSSVSDGGTASVNGGSSAEALAACSEIKAGAHFNAGAGTLTNPYIICSEQQLLNISLAEIDAKPTLTSAGSVKFPYMSKVFKLGRNLDFTKSEVEFFSIGHLMASLGRSSEISGSDKNLIATHDQRNMTDYVAKLSSQRIAFSGQLDGNNNSIVIGDYAPTESRLVGLFSVLSAGATIKNLVIKNFNVYAKGGVNIGCLAGSIVKSEQTKVSEALGILPRSQKITLDKIGIENCSLNDVVANSGALIGLARTYTGEELSVTNIGLSQISIDGGAETNFEPAYGDELLQSLPVLTRMHNIGALVGYVQVDGIAEFKNIILDGNTVSLEGFYTGDGRELDLGDMDFNDVGTIRDIDSIYSLMDNGSSDDFKPADPANSVGAMFGAINTSSNLARLNVSDISVSNSQTSFYESTRAAGTFAGSIGLLGGVATFAKIILQGNLVKFGMNDWSLPSTGVGMMAGVLSIGSSEASYSFSKIQIDGQILSDNAEASGDISGFIGNISALDEVVTIDNNISFSEIDIAGTAVLAGIDIRSIGSFAGTLVGKGSVTDPSDGLNKIVLSKINNDFVISTPDNYALAVGGFAGYLGSGVYTLSEVVVRTQIDVTNQYGFYNFVNAVVGLFGSDASIVASDSSYDASIREEFVTGIPEAQDTFTKI